MNTLVSHAVDMLKGQARVPGDKSVSHRAIMLSGIAAGETVITGLLEGEDVLRTARAMISMGVIVKPPEKPGGVWRVDGIGKHPLRQPRGLIDLGNSGTSTRLLMGMIAGYPVNATLTGDASLTRRPMGRVILPLSRMGAQFEATSGDRLPLKIGGSSSLRSIHYELPVASAQVKSAVILAALRAQGETTIIEPKPTRDHTERMLRFFGVDVKSETRPDGAAVITVSGDTPVLISRHIIVPSDPSSAAFPVVAALITPDSDIVVPNVLMNPLRGGLYETLKEMGANISFDSPREKSGESIANIRVSSSALKGVTVPPSRVPSMIDEFPILAVAAAFAEGRTVMTDLAELRVKESDRLTATASLLQAAGVKVETGADSMTIHG
ncbi:MAG: 3-phosphoshikimate 1-carboxyvinyltransferase, partial [Alphaproteobacteria bacterium]|nr:3-phosphoshikimate 1-carboxyvinyltransferase [Alphaproteobacteria bacterium]